MLRADARVTRLCVMLVRSSVALSFSCGSQPPSAGTTSTGPGRTLSDRPATGGRSDASAGHSDDALSPNTTRETDVTTVRSRADASIDSGLVPDAETTASADVHSTSGDPTVDTDVCGLATPSRPFDGRFARRRALETELGGDLQEALGLIADLDANGTNDLVLSRRSGTTLFHRQPGGGYAAPIPLPATTCSAAADLDGDGWLDLACSRGAGADPLSYANGTRQLILWGNASGRPGAESTLLPSPPPDDRSVERAVAPWDLDEDGLLDLVIAMWGPGDEGQGINRVFRNVGARQFEPVAESWGLDYPGYTWSHAFVDWDDDHHFGILVQKDGIDPSEFNHVLERTTANSNGDPRFVDLHGSTTCLTLELNPMGTSQADLRCDGSISLLLAGSEPDPILELGADVGCTPAFTFVATGREDPFGDAYFSWSPWLWDVDHDGRMDLMVGVTSLEPGPDANGSVFLYQGTEGLRFVEQHARVGLDSVGYFTRLHRGDLDDDGDLDVLAGGFRTDLAILENRIRTNGHHVLLDLVGQSSNPHGLGARVDVHAGALTRRYAVGGTHGLGTTPLPTLDIGVGEADRIDTLTIRWPSGRSQEVQDLPVGQRWVITEPEVFRIEPATRHVTADGTSRVVVSVAPESLDGAPISDDAVGIELVAGDATWAGPTHRVNRGSAPRVERELIAPSTPGSSVISITLGGEPVGLRPRVWFD